MSIKAVLYSLGLATVVLGAVFWPEGDPRPKEAVILKAVMEIQNQAHFSGATVDNDFSEKVFDHYMESLDYGKRFLEQPELDALAVYRDQIDDQIAAGDLTFFDQSLDIMNVAVDRAEGWYQELLSQPFDYTVKEYYETDSEDRNYLANDGQLKDFWRKMLKFETLTRLNRKLTKQEELKKIDAADLTDKDKDLLAKDFEALEKEAREDVLDVYKKWFDRMEEVRRSDRFEQYINSITTVLDPHTNFFNPKEKEDFDINMSGRLEGIGARLQTEDEMTKVVDVIPGGPAWKQHELEVGDFITAVRQEGDEEVEDITGMRIDDVVRRIRGKKGTQVHLTVTKKNGTEEIITIVRDEVIIDEGFAKSLIVQHDGVQHKLGYIFLPRFYSNFNSKDGPKASEDIRSQLEKLKAEGVEGIILDLRNNGGGSLQEVVDISGLFIEDGPIVQVKGRRGNPYVYKDEDESVVYDGPLVVMVNAYSASASEILAAALQDYDRAIIVGSAHTFGKGTVQRFIDLDRAVNGQADMKPLGQLKVTMQKYYRINGGSVQLKGVEPDIVLPDRFAYIETGEQEYDYAMPWSQIEGIDFHQEVYHPNGIPSIQAKSKERIAADSIFQIIDQQAIQTKEMRDESVRPLDLVEYENLVRERKEAADQFEDMFEPLKQLHLQNPQADIDYIQMDSSRIARNDKWKEGLIKDVYLQEAIYIASDLIDVNKP